ncbi:unnamed protein product, partial [Choristocarpus tenellus]
RQDFQFHLDNIRHNTDHCTSQVSIYALPCHPHRVHSRMLAQVLLDTGAGLIYFCENCLPQLNMAGKGNLNAANLRGCNILPVLVLRSCKLLIRFPRRKSTQYGF